MKLEKILDQVNSFEKNAFLKVIDGIIASDPRNHKEIEKILSDKTKDLKTIDNINVSKVFNLVEKEFEEHLRKEFLNTASQFDILIDIIIRDGNCIMKQDWLAQLYEKELKKIDKKIKELQKAFESDNSPLEEYRKRDYKIYRECLNTAFRNDEKNNHENKVTNEELSILITLSRQLELSQEETKLINYLVIPIDKLEIDVVINDLRNLGIIFYSRKNNFIYVADEIVRILRKVRGKEIADKFFRRVLKLLRDSQINTICRKHNIDWRTSADAKIKAIINEGISISDVLVNGIYKNGTKVTEKKKVVNELCDKGLKIHPQLKGITIHEKIANLIHYFEELEKDEKVGISIEGYERLLIEIGESLPKVKAQLREIFELQEENVLQSNYLLDYNIKPQDVLEVMSQEDLEFFCTTKEIKLRGNLIDNILANYKDAENLYLENYELFAYRDLNSLKENGIKFKEAELGVKFEELTKLLFKKLGFNVDEKLRKQINTVKDKADLVLNLGNNEIILVECKTNKESGYNKFSSVCRQLKAYFAVANKNNIKVVKSLIVAPEFSDEFIKDCGLDYELNLSLITASTLFKMWEGFKNSKHEIFPHNLLMRDVLIQEERVLKAIGR